MHRGSHFSSAALPAMDRKLPVIRLRRARERERDGAMYQFNEKLLNT